MTRLSVRVPVDGAAVHKFIDDVQAGRLCFPLPDVAPVAGIGLASLVAACRERVVAHIDYDDTLSMTREQVQDLLHRLGPDGDLTDDALAEAFLRDQLQPDRLNRRLWAVK
ncbi:hypothetical protein FHR83_006626 [Actinoplanes campanulatus]|uniref:Uncharacterized protein n=1 Tax=Actinoplanes campanulatus TaxID=113559 RepID=A0A7W5FHY2_9ACTN|nr:hypothetical protein [Actinoplanes campanulatus]MBB3098920.1 hypothetical protein [Actinoplanes campanulatus]GGN39847.1 hypothetical protein GCM10010109_68300 [Actinoplanes campanulatus]GID40124.1 hypothetical protein Aca09nite_66300 [Actinoplanes campanulatus]